MKNIGFVVLGMLFGCALVGATTLTSRQAQDTQIAYALGSYRVRLGECYWMERQVWIPDTSLHYHDSLPRIVNPIPGYVMQRKEPVIGLGCLKEGF